MEFDTSMLRNGMCEDIQFVFRNQPSSTEMKTVGEMANICQELRIITFFQEFDKSVKDCELTYIPKSFEKFSIEILRLSPSFAIDSVINEWPLEKVYIESGLRGCKKGLISLMNLFSRKEGLKFLHISDEVDTMGVYSGFSSLSWFSFSSPINYLDSNYFFLPNIRYIQVGYKAVASYIYDLDFGHLAPWKLGIRLLFDWEEYEFSLEVIESLKKKNPYVLWMAEYYTIEH
jgi:hypothetical protein